MEKLFDWVSVYWFSGGLIAVMLAALLTASAPRRHLLFVMLLWLAIPLAIFFGTAIREAIDPTPFNLFNSFIVGLAMAVVFTILPWALLSALGFGIGFLVRRMRAADSMTAGD